MNATTYPEQPGFKASGTSQEAAQAIAPEAAALQALCLTALQHQPMTPDECAELLRRDKLSIRPRFAELKEMGMIEPTGERRKNASGRNADVCRIKREVVA